MTTPDIQPVHTLILEKRRLDAQTAQLADLVANNRGALYTAVQQAVYLAVIDVVGLEYRDAVMRGKISQIQNLTGSNYTDAFVHITWEANPNSSIQNDPFIEELQKIKKMNNSNSRIDITNRSRNADERKKPGEKEKFILTVQGKVADLLGLLDESSKR